MPPDPILVHFLSRDAIARPAWRFYGYPSTHIRANKNVAEQGGFTPGMGSTRNTDDSKQARDYFHFVNTRRWTLLRLESTCREHKYRMDYTKLRQRTRIMYIQYHFAYVARRIGGTLGGRIIIFIGRYSL